MKVAIYLRVSSEQQAERELSIPAQREALMQYVNERGWHIVTEYIDEAKSAKTADRPDFQKMIAAAQQMDKQFEVILVHKFDRFSRNRTDHVVYKSLLKQFGVLVVSALEPTEPETPHGVLLEGMLEVLSEFYNVNLRHETIKGMRENAMQGFHCGGRVPFGYRRIQKGKKVFYGLGDDVEVSIVKQIFNMASEGHGGKKISRHLNMQGLPVGRRWIPSTVLAILDNQAYLGHRVWNKRAKQATPFEAVSYNSIVTPNAHPAIVTQKQWDAAHAYLDSRKKS